MTLAGELALWLALLCALWSAATSIASRRFGHEPLARSGAWAMYAAPLLVLLAMTGLAAALLRPDFTLVHVANHASLATPWLYRLSATWAGVDGSLLLWSLALATHGALLTHAVRRRSMPSASIATAIAAMALAVLLAILVFTAYPYARLTWAPPDGQGLAPELQHRVMAVHPPMLHFGYAALVAPFALALAAMAHPGPDASWLGLARRWAAVSWALLTAAILAGMRWALLTPGWQRLWEWEPVQALVLLAWVMASVLVHRAPVEGRWPGARRIVVWLCALSFPIALLGLASAHAGESGGRHAFRSSPAEPPLVAAVLVAASVAIALVIWRGNRVPAAIPRPRAWRSLVAPAALITHAGVLLIAAGLAAQTATRTYHVALQPAHAVELTDPLGGVWRLVSQGESRDRAAGREVTMVGLDVARNAKPLGLVAPEIRQYASAGGDSIGPVSPEVALRSTPLMDMTVTLEDLPTPVASLAVTFHPLALAIWLGGLLGVVGTIASAFREED